MSNELGGSGLDELFLVAETPKNGNVRETGITSGLYIDFAVTYVDGFLFASTELMQGKFYHVGGRFQGDSLALPDGHVHHVAEIGGVEFIDTGLELVTNNGGFITTNVYFMEHVCHTWVETGVVLTVDEIVLPEERETTFNRGNGKRLGDRALDEFAYTITNETTYLRK